MQQHGVFAVRHYAENLLGHFFQHEGLLFGKSLQINDKANHTIGEFDLPCLVTVAFYSFGVGTQVLFVPVNWCDSAMLPQYLITRAESERQFGAKMQKNYW